MSTSTQRTTVLGTLILEGNSKKSGKDYSFAKLFVMYPQTGAGVQGYMSTELSCDAMVARKIDGHQFPLEADIEVANVMSFGKLQQQIMSISPIGIPMSKQAAKAL
jgi:hypothetical protein